MRESERTSESVDVPDCSSCVHPLFFHRGRAFAQGADVASRLGKDISKDVSASAASAPSGRVLVFHLGERYGSVSPDGTIAFSRGHPSTWPCPTRLYYPITRDSSALVVLKPDGSTLSRVEGTGWPFFRSGRPFSFVSRDELHHGVQFGRKAPMVLRFSVHDNGV
jgi:hypothetical protein